MFQKYPAIDVQRDTEVAEGWDRIIRVLRERIAVLPGKKKVVVVEYYHGVLEEEVTRALVEGLVPDFLLTAASLYRDISEVKNLVHPDVTDDRLFGRLTRLTIEDFFEPDKLQAARQRISSHHDGILLVVGSGAAIIPEEFDLLVYADMARWEIQLRMRRHEISNLGVSNKDTEDWMLLYKQGYFVDWRVCDRLKKQLMTRWDFLLDTNDRSIPKLIDGESVREGLKQALQRPFSVVPFFDPGPWGGQWLKKICNLDRSVSNYAWCFNCVPEENSLLLSFGGTTIEIPSLNLVLFDPQSLLGEAVREQFGDEFPIRFDYLDTMDGGNLSLQVHPLTEYIREQFGIQYTQDESYYIMEARDGAVVYLGLRDGIDPDEMIAGLVEAEKGSVPFDAERYVQTWPVRKHEHYLIPAGTIHCSGKNSVVLEISATPYIFTFKLWDWGRLGLDGKPRPINIDHGKRSIQWERTTLWTEENLANRVERVASGDGWVEERTGLHEREFIETRRHWFTGTVSHETGGGVNVLCLVEGDEIVVESPTNAFPPFQVHYAETFIVPASVGNYTIRPAGSSNRKKCATIKAYVRTNS
ncbi:MAG: class I mannose-6-phosphate isomerase [Bacteroidota bacterium]